MAKLFTEGHLETLTTEEWVDLKKLDKLTAVSASNLLTAPSEIGGQPGMVPIDDFATASQGTKADTAYQKPSSGVPKTDLASAVQTSLGKADSALQSFTETDPTVPAWAKAAQKPAYTASEVGAAPANASLTAETGSATDMATGAVASTTLAAVLQTIWGKMRQLVNVISGKANDADVVKLTGTQTVAGTKTFSTSPVVPSKTSAAGNNATSIATEAQVYSVAARVDSLEVLGQYVGTFDTKALIPSNKSGFTNGITLNDFINVRADETQNGATTRYIATAISSAGVITWTYDITFSTDISGKQDKLNRTVGGNDNATGTVTDTGGNLSVPVPVTVVAPSASTTQITAGTRSLRSTMKILIDNIANLFSRMTTAETNIDNAETNIDNKLPLISVSNANAQNSCRTPGLYYGTFTDAPVGTEGILYVMSPKTETYGKSFVQFFVPSNSSADNPVHYRTIMASYHSNWRQLATMNDISGKANDADVVKLTGTQTVAGTKTFSTSPVVPSKTSAAGNSATSIATEAQVYSVASRVDGLEVLGQYVGTFDTKALIPANKSGFTNSITINDFVNVRADETHNGAVTRYIATAISSAGVITWTYDITFSTDISGKQDKLNRTVGGNDNATGTVTDTGGNLSVPVPVTVVAPSASTTQITAGTRSLRSTVKILIDNIANLFSRMGTAETNIDGKAPTNHDHAIANITALQAALDGKIDGNIASIVAGTSSTAVGTAAKTVSITGFTRSKGSIVAVTFTNGNSSTSATLNVTSTGAAGIRKLNRTTVPVLGDIPAGHVATLYYDGEFWILLNPANLATTNPSALGTVAAGTSNLAARQDHVHAMPTNLLPYSAPATSGNGNRILGLNSSATALEWKDLPASSSAPASNIWTTGANAPTSAYCQTSQLYNGKIYCLAYTSTIQINGTTVHFIQIYDTVSGSWTTGNVALAGGICYTSQLYNGKIYCPAYNTAALHIYDIDAYKWSTGAPGGISCQTSQLYNGKIYCPTYTSTALRIYDIASDTWSTGADAPADINRFTSQLDNGKIYCPTSSNTAIQIYNTVYDIWTTGASAPASAHRYTSQLYNGKIYCPEHAGTAMHIYDIASNTWSTGASAPASAHRYTSQLCNGKIYCPASNNSTAIHIYDIASNTWSTGASAPGSANRDTSQLYNGKIYCPAYNSTVIHIYTI